MSATINDPFLLSTYPHSNNKPGKKQGKQPQNILAHYSSANNVTITAQRDGIHVLDVSTLHPIISHTLGPSTSFSCPAITQTADNESTCTTYAVIASSPDIPLEDVGRTVWWWSENLNSSLAERTLQKKNSALIPHAISALYASPELPTRVLILSPSGQTTIADAQINVLQTHPAPANRTTLHSWVFARKASSSFVPSRTAAPNGAVLVLLESEKTSTRVRIVGVAEIDEGGIVELGDLSLEITPESIVTASCSTDGYLSVLTRDGSWHAFQLESRDATTISLTTLPSITLANFTFISSKSAHAEISLLALTSSHVLLAGTSKTTPSEVLLQTWDLQYSVLLTSTSFPAPSTLPSTGNSFELIPGHQNDNHALLVLSPPATTTPKNDAVHRSSVFVVPYSVPRTSTISAAMGKAAAAKPWLSSASSTQNSDKLDASQTKVLSVMKDAIEGNRPQAAASAFLEWDAKNAMDGVDKRKNHYPAEFVSEVLETVLQTNKGATTNVVYSNEVVKFLLGKGVVPGPGLLGALRARSDWTSITLALETVIDIPEDDVLETLAYVLSHQSQPNPDAMQVDENDTTITTITTIATTPLPAFLASCVNYSTSPIPLRLAVRKHLSAAEDVTKVLVVLESWVARWGVRDVVLVIGPAGKKGHSEKEVPALSKVLSFLQTILDASFIALLQYPPSHAILRKLSAHLHPEVAFSEQLQQLQAPLEPFVKAQKDRKEKEKNGGGKEKEKVDWRKKRREEHERVGVAVGLYRLEELVL